MSLATSHLMQSISMTSGLFDRVALSTPRWMLASTLANLTVFLRLNARAPIGLNWLYLVQRIESIFDLAQSGSESGTVDPQISLHSGAGACSVAAIGSR